MNTSDRTPDTTLEEQASLWAARLDGSTLSNTERQALTAWLSQDPRHRVVLSEYCQLSTDLEEQLPALIGTAAVPVPRDEPVRRKNHFAKTWFVATALAAAAAIGVALLPRDQAVAPQSIATSIGQRQVLDLADGSRIELNARTSLVVESGKTERRVRLASGEAFFSVAKDPSRPFIVETPAGSVQVTGTAFNVRSEATSEIEVTVLEGSVQVRPGETQKTTTPVNLTAAGRFTGNDRGTSFRLLTDTELDAFLAWRQGHIVFDNVPLREALARFAHFHGRGITAAAEVANLNIGGRYSLDDLEGFFSALEDIYGVRVSRDSSGTIRVSSRTKDHASPTF